MDSCHSRQEHRRYRHLYPLRYPYIRPHHSLEKYWIGSSLGNRIDSHQEHREDRHYHHRYHKHLL